MTFTLALFMVIGGLIALSGGGDILLRGAVSLARRSGLSPLLIGLSIVAAGTSLPELIVSIDAALQGATDVGVGNVVGSNIANIFLILGAGALIAPITAHPRQVMKDTLVALSATLLLIAFAFWGEVGWVQGLIMVAALIAFLFGSYRIEKNTAPVAPPVSGPAESGPAESGARALLLIVIGLAGLVFGADILIEGALFIARAAGVPEIVIGLTLVALGTSLPELATVVVAAVRGQSDVALGNVLGSNIFNILMILGILALVSPFHVAPQVIAFDLWVMLGSSLILLPLLLWCGKISRWQGGVFLLLYILYIGHQFGHRPAIF